MEIMSFYATSCQADGMHKYEAAVASIPPLHKEASTTKQCPVP